MLRFDRALFRGVGTIETADIAACVAPDGCPRPLLIVGRNGAGKTLALAHIADALLEFARVAFAEVERAEGNSKSYFKLNSPANQRSGAKGGPRRRAARWRDSYLRVR